MFFFVCEFLPVHNRELDQGHCSMNHRAKYLHVYVEGHFVRKCEHTHTHTYAHSHSEPTALHGR